MSEREKQMAERMVDVLKKTIPNLNELGKARTLGYLEGMAAMAAYPRNGAEQDTAKPA